MSDFLVSGILGLIFTIIAGVVLHLISKQSKRQEDIEEQLRHNTEAIISLKTTAVSDAHVRSIMKEEVQPLVQPLSEALGNVLISVRDIQLSLAERKGFEAAQQLYSKRKTDNKIS